MNQVKVIFQFLLFISLATSSLEAAERVSVDPRIKSMQKFESRYFGEGDMNAALAMKISYLPVVKIRRQIEASLYNGKRLKFLTAWEPNGEAHVTTIGPFEYQKCMWSKKRGLSVLHMKQIEQLALKMQIQKSDLKIQALGVAFKKFEDLESSHFILVRSNNLLRIRRAVYAWYLRKGGEVGCWNPNLFFPHITVGYTHEDIHYPDVKKNIKFATDRRFRLVPEKSPANGSGFSRSSFPNGSGFSRSSF
ncbi:hypothetical protein N9D31_03165 [Oligoflexaceae bacterium]|nr:hypothetical protein [Oligoflexaceae bacterium]